MLFKLRFSIKINATCNDIFITQKGQCVIMTVDLLSYSAAMCLSIGIAWLICRHADWLGYRFGLMDIPDPIGGRKRHDRDTPLLGGTAALLPTFGIMAFGTILADLPNRQVQSDILVMTLVAVILFLIGLLDDRSNLSARFRLIVSAVVASIAVLSTPYLALDRLLVTFSDMPMMTGIFAGSISILCLVGLINAINMADGKNGLVVGMCIIWTMALFFYAPNYLRPTLAALLGSLVVVFIFNIRGKLFLGDGGSYGLASLIGCLTIYIYNLRFDVLSADQIVLWFIVPVLDCLRLLILRKARGQSPFAADRNHLHHYLALKWTWDNGRFIYWLLIGLPTAMSVLLPKSTPLLIGLTFCTYVGLIWVAEPQQKAAKSAVSA
jgi:UDP-GlcNAc:undecaprenyl-phosphate/decaprenyl-phosphate GlcNAc-1-phosphate transferase